MQERNLKFKIIFLTVIIFGLFGLAKGSAAANWYVRTDGNNNCNGTTDAAGSSGNCAFRTILKGTQTAQAGDTVTVHSGDYTSETLASVRSGSSGNLITIKAATGETVTIPKITLSHDYMVIQGFRTVPASGNIYNATFNVTGNHNQVLSNTILGGCTAGAESCMGVVIQGWYNTVSYNTFDGQNNNSATSFQVAMYSTGNYNQMTYNTVKDTNSIERVWEVYGGCEGLNVIAHNEVKNVQESISGISHPDLFQIFGTSNSCVLVEDNYFHDFGGQIGNMIMDVGGNFWTFRNNVFANVSNPIDFQNMTTYWYNNTFYHCTQHGYTYTLSAVLSGNDTYVYNNAFIAGGTGVTDGWYSGVGNADYNFVSNTATGGAKTGFSETHGINGSNPQLIAYNTDCINNTCDFHVGATSALVDTGEVISGFSIDKDGTPRPQGSAWDIGAYEYSAGGGDTTAPSAPSGLSVL